jgi:hypothetical protein
MKFTISENKLKDLKQKLVKYKMSYLDSYVNSSTVRKFDSFIVIENPSNDWDFEEPHMEYDYEDGRLYVNKELRHTFSSMFGDSREESDILFKRWFEDRFGVEIAFLD